MDSLACPACGYDPSKDSNFDGKPKKLCGRCTLKLGPDANDRVGKFKDWLNQALLEDSSVPDSDLVEEGANFGLPHLASKKIVEAIKEEISRLPQGKLLIYYDVETTSAAIACGKTVVPLQIENGLPQSLEKVEVHVAHPETGVLVSAVAIPGLLRRKTKETEIHLELQAIGIHTIRNGFIVATGNSGASEVYQLAESIRIQAKDGAVSTTSINHWSQNITTHGSASVLADGRQSSQSSPGAKWKSVKIVRCGGEAFAKFEEDCKAAESNLALANERARVPELPPSVIAPPAPEPPAPARVEVVIVQAPLPTPAPVQADQPELRATSAPVHESTLKKGRTGWVVAVGIGLVLMATLLMFLFTRSLGSAQQAVITQGQDNSNTGGNLANGPLVNTIGPASTVQELSSTTGAPVGVGDSVRRIPLPDMVPDSLRPLDEPRVVNIDAIRNATEDPTGVQYSIGSVPVDVPLPAGAYDFIPIGPESGGAYDGLVQSTATPFKFHYYDYFTSDNPSVVRSNTAVAYRTAVEAIAGAAKRRVVLESDGWVRFFLREPQSIDDNAFGVSIKIVPIRANKSQDKKDFLIE